MTSSRRRLFVVVAWVATVVLVGGSAFAAGRWTFSPPTVATAERPGPTYSVAEATVGETLDLQVEVTWVEQASGVNAAAGTVTRTVAQGLAPVDVGNELYSVNLRPVVIARGAVPSFRDLARDVVGPDVTQLQQFLVDSGYLTATPNGTFGGSTEAAVKAWQRAIGIEQTGIVLAGDLLFVAQLPALVILDEALYPGAQLTPGQQVVSVVAAEPSFAARIDVDQLGLLTEATSDISITGPSSVWAAKVGNPQIRDGEPALLPLTPAEGTSICGSECGALEYSPDGVALNAQIVVTPEMAGPAVPLSALGTAANDEVFVVDTNGARKVVEVKVKDGSQAIVSGVEVGDVVRLFAVEDGGSPEPVPSGPDES